MCRILAIFSVLLLSGISFIASADTPFKSNLEVTLGGFFPEVDTSVSITSTSGLGRSFDFEDIFGLDENDSSIFGGIEYRFNDRHGIEANYINLNRDAGRTLAKNITLGDTTYSIGTSVKTKFDYNVYRLSYVYNAFTTENYAIGIALGLHITEIDINVKTKLAMGAGRESELSVSIIPLPAIGLRGNWRIADNWIIDSKVDAFSLSSGDANGYLLNIGAAIEYDRFKYISLGAGWDYYDLNLEAEKKKFNGEVEYEYSGPTVYLKGRF